MSTTTAQGRVCGGARGRHRRPAARGRFEARRWPVMALIAVALVGTGCVQVQTAEGGFVMGGSIVVDRGEVAREDVVAVGGNVRIDGRAERDVVVVAGRLEINGEVERSVSCVGGTLVLGPRARIGRDVVLVGGRLERDDRARIGGEFVNVSIGFGAGDWFAPMQWGLGSWWGVTPFAWIARTSQLFYWLLLAVLAVALVGDRVSSASHAISREPVRMGAIGAVGLFALCFALLILVVLSFLIIGIPFLLALIFVWWLAYIFGAVAVFQAIGNRVMNMAGRPEASQIAIVLAGGLVLGILRYVPFFGGLIWLVAALVGFGSVFATRFGTGRPWVRRGPPPPPAGTPYAPPPPPPRDPVADASAEASAGPTEFDDDDAYRAGTASDAGEDFSTGAPDAADHADDAGEVGDDEAPAEDDTDDRMR